MSLSIPLVRVHRGDLVESVHRGSVVLIDGERTHAAGDADQWVYYRSASKPLQALVAITSGAADGFGLSAAELALAAGSHSACPEHLAAAASILAKAGIDEERLQCGGHYSIDANVSARQHAETSAPPRLWSNCSGKHAAMLAAAKAMDAPLETYLEFDHPVQREIRSHIAAASGIAFEDIRLGIDGCNAPAFAVPLRAIARSAAALGAPTGLPQALADAMGRVAAAMHTHPDMVAGPGRFDTDLMQSSAETIFAKAGAEGVQALTVPGRDIALAVKVDDGADRGYRAVVIELLRRRGVLTDAEAAGLRTRQCPEVIVSNAGLPAGRLEVVVEGF